MSVIPSLAMSQTLVGDDVSVRAFAFPDSDVATVTVVDPGIELDDAAEILGFPVMLLPDGSMGPGRFDIDIQASRIVVEFMDQSQDLGNTPGGPLLTFFDLEPECPNGQTGLLGGVEVVTTIDPNRIVLDALGDITGAWGGEITWDTTFVSIDYAEQLRFDTGDVIELDLTWNCNVAPELTITGTCPGPVNFEVTNLPHGADIEVWRAFSSFPGSLTSGACAGSYIELTDPKSLVTVFSDTNNDGVISGTPNVGSANCGVAIAIAETDTCWTSNAAYMP
jgi:hypothetical protein